MKVVSSFNCFAGRPGLVFYYSYMHTADGTDGLFSTKKVTPKRKTKIGKNRKYELLLLCCTTQSFGWSFYPKQPITDFYQWCQCWRQGGKRVLPKDKLSGVGFEPPTFWLVDNPPCHLSHCHFIKEKNSRRKDQKKTYSVMKDKKTAVFPRHEERGQVASGGVDSSPGKTSRHFVLTRVFH